MKILLKSLSLTNFKGIRSLSITFDEVTNISGANGTGKTTIFDAFLWLLFGKDSNDRKDFEIKTLDSNNEAYHRLDHEVTAAITVDMQDIVIKRTLKENWVKKRGENTTVFSGHTTSFFWNDVPMKESDYQAKIGDILNEGIFKLITNTEYFNALKWPDRRNVLLQLAGTITNEEIFDKIITVSNKGQFTALINALNNKKSADDFKKELGSKKKRIREELEHIPSRISEANLSLPEVCDYDSIQKEIVGLEESLKEVEEQLMDKTSAEKEKQQVVLSKMKDVQGLREKKQNHVFAIKNKFKDQTQLREQVILDRKRELKLKLDELTRIASEKSNEGVRKGRIEQEITKLKEQWFSVDKEKLEFNESEFSCPTCKRGYDAALVETKKEEFTRNFNQNKASRLSSITESGKKLKNDLASIESKISNLNVEEQQIQTSIDSLKESIDTLSNEHNRLLGNELAEINNSISTDPEIKSIDNRISEIESEINTPSESEDNSTLLQTKRELQLQLDGFKKSLSSKEHRDRILVRIEELKKQESEMSAELANLEGAEFSIDQYIKAKMDLLIDRINNRFTLVKFKLFAEQINGGTVECCETLINGVPYSDANTASRINAGLDIINTLSDHYKVSAPVFVDNAESVNTLLPLNSQLIRLIVTTDKKLKVQATSTVMEAA